jgi:aminocarboxymuconate-semialdehyde decarboxylase
MQGVRTIWDLDARLKMMTSSRLPEILSLGLPPIECDAGPDLAPEFARVANDGLAERASIPPLRRLGRRTADERRMR